MRGTILGVPIITNKGFSILGCILGSLFWETTMYRGIL